MGSGLMHIATARLMNGGGKGLSSNARLVLLIMALEAHDTGTDKLPRGCYFRGWEHLAIVLGYDSLNPAGRQAVARAIRELAADGLITRDQWQGHNLRKTVYQLEL